jgi:hypothetical protein
VEAHQVFLTFTRYVLTKQASGVAMMLSNVNAKGWRPVIDRLAGKPPSACVLKIGVQGCRSGVRLGIYRMGLDPVELASGS